MHEAKIFWSDKACRDVSKLVAFHSANSIGHWVEFSTVILGYGYFPSSLYRAPYDLVLGIGGKAFTGDRERGPGRTMRGRNLKLSDVAARSFEQWDFRSKLWSARGRPCTRIEEQ